MVVQCHFPAREGVRATRLGRCSRHDASLQPQAVLAFGFEGWHSVFDWQSITHKAALARIDSVEHALGNATRNLEGDLAKSRGATSEADAALKALAVRMDEVFRAWKF